VGDLMRPISFLETLKRIVGEYQADKTIFGIPAKEFYRRNHNKFVNVFAETCETAVGPAAGPHTQLTQNIITSWLTGGRFIELKTVQIMDHLEIEKPCIDAEDEAFNTEWSTEFTLKKAYDEYLKAWFILYLLEEIFDPRMATQARSFIFNMSVGYDLKGIKELPMQEFINNMIDSSQHPKFFQYREILRTFVSDPQFIALFGLENRTDRLCSLPDKIPTKIVSSLTLSTMHGCPPQEIEAICRYMLEEKKLHTFVKLNPTLLGYERVRAILDECGFDYIGLNKEGFSHDLVLQDALSMLHRLVDVSKKQGLGFGVKLTNTLASINEKGVLPGNEMYMSGRALFPLSINVALVLSKEFNGQLPISFSGGANQFNINEIFETGIRPITMATDLLKPGGYLRMTECAKRLDESEQWDTTQIDVNKLETLAKKSLSVDYTQKSWRSSENISVHASLPITDCYVAPCVVACPIEQNIPEYLFLVGEGRYVEALELIYARNALPAITGHICDHQCQYNCTRRDYESALDIRAIKKIAVEKGWEGYKAKWHKPALVNKKSVAVLGAGPAGLSVAYFLARAGHPVILFEKEKNAGGVVNNIVPKFRIPAEIIQHDINFVAEHGVEFIYGCDNLTIQDLKNKGYQYICLGIGVDKGTEVKLAGNNTNIYKSLNFLRQRNQGAQLRLGEHVAIIGAGNTAMDSARSALKAPGVKQVTVFYRRTEKEMPAYREEYLEALEEGVQFKFLSNPEQFDQDGQLTVRVMALGDKDEKGRRRPVATDKTFTAKVDTVVTAAGEKVDYDLLHKIGLPLEPNGIVKVNDKTCETELPDIFLIGDAQSGPSSIVAAIGGARKAADTILAREKKSYKDYAFISPTGFEEIYARKAHIPLRLVGANKVEEFAKQEAKRCLECSYICSKCTDVCPNRANLSLPIPGFRDPFQIIHIDAYCNECGNCGQFCPWDDRPYKDKVTIFNLQKDFDNSTNPGFLINGDNAIVRLNGKTHTLKLEEGQLKNAPSELNDISRIIHFIHKEHSYLLGAVEE
jgi:putative selenate reductase